MRIEFLDKAKADSVLPKLFAILHSNMSRIAPTGNTYEQDFEFWIPCIKSDLENEQRQMLLIFSGDELAGFFQYSVNNHVFWMERINFTDPYKGTGIFSELYRYLVKILLADTLYVEALADKRNEKSIAVLKHLGLEIIGENKNGISYHFRGRYENLIRRYHTQD